MTAATDTGKVTVVMLTRNAGPLLEESLASAAWADEIIAIDAGSTDGTLERLEAHGARVLPQDLDLIEAHHGNFDVARNQGFEAATGEWILVLDADEVVTPELRREVSTALRASTDVAFQIPRTNLFWGRPSRVLGEDLQLRLFPRGAGRYSGTRLDQPLQVDCATGRLQAPLIHRQNDLLGKLRYRTDQRAAAAHLRGEAPEGSPPSLFWHHLIWYLRRKEAWKDGPRGVLLAGLFAAYPALTALKLRRLCRNTRPSP